MAVDVQTSAQASVKASKEYVASFVSNRKRAADGYSVIPVRTNEVEDSVLISHAPQTLPTGNDTIVVADATDLSIGQEGGSAEVCYFLSCGTLDLRPDAKQMKAEAALLGGTSSA